MNGIGEVVGLANGMMPEAQNVPELPEVNDGTASNPAEIDEAPVIDIIINNVVSSFSVGCHLELRQIARSAHNVEYRRGIMVTLKIRNPPTTASIWSSGKITCTGSTSEDEARRAARRIARVIQKLEYPAKFRNFRIVNVLGTCTMPFNIKITPFSQTYREAASYEPELHPGVTYKIDHPKATLKIFSTGSITVTAPSVSNVQYAIEHIYPKVQSFAKARTPEEIERMRQMKEERSPTPVSSDDESFSEFPDYEDI
ncbi:LOW QUALITY PROTEIN: TATA box-binding protein-like 1 [Palaemon carinicauda]|uniref:LOW QUALITY PROTEIN: TATA box-binding protein-like 1 n=1 Tax=Palaemon carinicauda TaxID=392227 RepID=UPI0035B5A7C2